MSGACRNAATATCVFCSFRPRVKSWVRHGLKPWLEAPKKRLHHNVLAIALANKLARIAWSVLAHGRALEAAKIQVA